MDHQLGDRRRQPGDDLEVVVMLSPGSTDAEGSDKGATPFAQHKFNFCPGNGVQIPQTGMNNLIFGSSRFSGQFRHLSVQ